jgi:PAS domain S-box-containing protein
VSEPRDATTSHNVSMLAPEDVRLRFLAEAGEILAASLDYETELERVARLAVPTLADWCVVDLLGDDGCLHRLAIVHGDPALADMAAELMRRYPVLSPGQPHRIWQVLRDGRAWIDPAIAAERFVAEARDPEHLSLLRRLGFSAEMVLPLLARGRTLGAITLVLAGDDRRYGPAELALAEELVQRAALAIDNARLYSEAQAAEARYRGLFAGVADAIVVANGEGVCQDVNDAASDLLGYARDELVGLKLGAVVTAPAGAATDDESPREFWQSGWRGELELRHKGGTIVPLEARTTAVELPTGTVFLSVLRDITERRRADEDRQRLAAIIESTDDAVIGKTLDGIVTSWNPGAERMYGYTAHEMVGQSILRIFPPDRAEELWEILERLRHGERDRYEDTVRLTKDGRRIDVSVGTSPIVDASGVPAGAAIIARDVTERKRLETMQRDFVAMVAHDLRSPLTVLRARAQLLRRRGAYQQEAIDVILAQTDRMARLIDDLADAIRLEEGLHVLQREPIDLVALAREAAATAQELSALHTILVDAPDGPIAGSWDRVRLGQVLENVLGNAIKHGTEGGEVVVRVAADNGEARLSVSDTGPGIDPRHLPRLFERFYQAETTGAWGLGLGLYISRMLVFAHGGRIWAESELGRGSAFFIVLPLGT